MSRVGKKPIAIPKGVTVAINDRLLTAKGPKGEQKVIIPDEISFNLEDGILTFARSNDFKKVRALHGLTRALCSNAIEGVAGGFQKKLAIEGVGYKAEIKGKRLMLNLGFSHPILIIPPAEIELATPTATSIIVSGPDKQMVGQIAALVRSLKKPEPYKGKGIRYEGEYIRRKAGKTAGK